jgi:chorismate mutase
MSTASTGAPRLRALRGATTIAADDPEAIVAGTGELLRAMLERNSVRPEDVVSIVFTATPDLRAEFPAAAARHMGLTDVPLLCAAEIAVPGAPGRCVRVLMHLYTPLEPGALDHVYLGEARSLRGHPPGEIT